MVLARTDAVDHGPQARTSPPQRAERVSVAEYPLFDWLRFVLASVVALFHGGVLTWHWWGYLAVQVFFALSGWLIGGILLRTPAGELPRFFFNRGTRIWIPYAIAVAILYAVSALREPVGPYWLSQLTYDLTFTHNLYALKPNPETALPLMPLQGTSNHFWSIGVEEQFYLAAPLLMLFVPFGRTLWVWIPLAVLCVATGGWFGAISLGVAAAIARRDFGDWHLRPGFRAAILVAVLALGAAIALPDAPVTHIAPVFAVAVVLAAAGTGARGPVGEFFGGLSYPLYLNHWIPFFIMHGALKHLGFEMSLPVELAVYVLAVAGAGAHFLLIDRSIQANRARHYTVARGRAFQATAYALLAIGIAFGIASWGAPYWG